MSGNFRCFLFSKALVWFSASSPHSFLFSTAGAVIRAPEKAAGKENGYVVDYLVNSCGLLEKKSLAASASLGRLKSPAKPDSVLEFLRTCGLSDAQIAAFVSRRPKLLFCDVEKFLAPKFKFFQNLGMSAAEVAEIMQKTSSRSLDKLDPFLVHRIEFLRSIVASDHDLVKLLKRSVWCLTASDDICNRMLANIARFKKLGVDENKIKKLIPKIPRLFQMKPDLVDTVIGRVESELGITHQSGMFYYAVCILCQLSPSTIKTRFRIFEEFGWSMSDITTLCRNQPPCLRVSDEKLRRGLEFLMRTVGCSPSYIAKRPTLLMMNFEKRLLPRYDVFSMLKAKDLIGKEESFYAAINRTEKSFLEKYVLKYVEMAPDVYEAYLKRGKLARK